MHRAVKSASLILFVLLIWGFIHFISLEAASMYYQGRIPPFVPTIFSIGSYLAVGMLAGIIFTKRKITIALSLSVIANAIWVWHAEFLKVSFIPWADVVVNMVWTIIGLGSIGLIHFIVLKITGRKVSG